MPLHVRTIGSGPRVVLVHGSVNNSATWQRQHELGSRFTLVIPDRRGYPPNPPADRIDFDDEAGEIAALLGGGAHLGGFSYGGVIALLAAARRADAVRSLTVIEPPCFAVARGVPEVDELVEHMSRLWRSGITDPREFARRFAAAFGEAGQVPAEVPPEREQGVRALMAERGPWEAEIPLDALGRSPFPKLVCSSDGHPAFEAVCDVLERRLGAQRLVLRGAGHAVHRAPGFNDSYGRFLDEAERLWAERRASGTSGGVAP